MSPISVAVTHLELQTLVQAFFASERMGRLGEETIYVKLSDGRGWVFESLDGTRVLERVTPSSMEPPMPPSPPPPSPMPPPNLRNGFRSEAGGKLPKGGADVSVTNVNGTKS